MSVASVKLPLASTTLFMYFCDATFWKGRLPLVSKMLREEKFDIVGMQEPLWHQMKDMDEALKKDYAWVGCSIHGQIKNGKGTTIPYFIVGKGLSFCAGAAFGIRRHLGWQVRKAGTAIRQECVFGPNSATRNPASGFIISIHTLAI